MGEAAALYSETPIADLPWGESLKWNATGGGWLLFHTTHVDDQGKVAARLPRVAVRERDRLLLSQDRMLALVRSDQHASGLLTVLKLSSDVDQQLRRAMARISSPAAKEAPPTASPAAVAQAEPPRPAATAPRQPSERQPSEEPPPPAWKATIDPPTQPVAVKQPPRPIRAARLATFLYPRQPSPYVAMVESEEGRCRLADLRTGKDVGAVSAKFEFRGKVAVSADGRYLAGENSADRGKAVSVWSFQTGTRCAEIDHSSVPFVDHLVFAGPDQLLVSQNDSEQYRIAAWDVKQAKQAWAIAIRKPRNADKVGVEASPGGKYIAVLIDRVLHVLEAATGQAVGTSLLPVPWDVVTPRCVQCGALQFSPDGSELAAACSSHRLLLCWDFGSGELVLSRTFPKSMIADMDSGRLAWFPDKGGWLLGDNLVVERKTGAPVWRLDTRLRDPFQVLGLDSVLTVASANNGNEDQIVDVRLPGDQLTAAFQAARRAPSETVPPLTKPDLSGMESISPNPGTDAWSYQPDGVAARDAAPRLSVSLGGPRIVLQEFRLATEDFGRAVLQTTVREEERRAVLPGPRQPLRRSQLQVYDTSQGKLLGEIETTGWSDMVDGSPDGSLVLTANSAEPQFGPYDRLDIWAPLLKKHAVGWQPVIVAAANREQQVTWAAFIDKRHVLTRSPAELVYWELPACQAKYRIASFGEVIALSPLRKHVVGLSADRGFRVYETATGRCLGRFEQPTCEQMSFPLGWFRPDGQQLLVMFYDLEYTLVVVYELTTGKIASAFGIPQVTAVDLQWLDPRYVFLQTYPRNRGKRYLLDLENRALVAQYGAGTICSAGHLDGLVWQAVASQPGPAATFQLKERRFSLPVTGPRLEDHAYLCPGAEVAVSVNSSVLDRQDVTEELTQRLTAAGLSVRASASRRFELEVADSTAGREARLGDGRLLSSRTVELRWRAFDTSGTKVWEQRRGLPWSAISVTSSQSEAKQVTREALREQARKAVSGLSIPRYLFPRIEAVKLPDSSL